jgi:hypothetical protein
MIVPTNHLLASESKYFDLRISEIVCKKDLLVNNKAITFD